MKKGFVKKAPAHQELVFLEDKNPDIELEM